jgi:cell division protein FtsI/penicillin-binding protein 2
MFQTRAETRLGANVKYASVSILFILIFVFIFYKLYDIQYVKNDFYIKEAQKQYIGINYDLERGNIYFDNRKTGRTLAADVKEKMIKKEGKEISLSDRNFPFADIGSKVIGFVAYDENNNRVGRYGIEKYYDDVLSREGGKIDNNFFAEVFGNIKGKWVSDKPVNEGSINLTIDSEMQKYLYQILEETRKTWNSDDIGGIIMNPKDGRIYAMEELPSFDPNKFNEVEDAKLYKNNLVSGVYEMGSIIKPLTMAAALDAGVVDESTTYNDTGTRNLNGYKVSNYDKVARGISNIQLILDQSLNVGIVFLVEKLGATKFQDYFAKYGLREETGIDLPSESAGLTRNLDSSIFVDAATAGFGQGIAITPIQTIRALASLGNGGKLVNPYVVDSIQLSNGDVKKVIPDEGTQILKDGTSERITRMLVHVVDYALAKGKRKMEHYSIAAKTGTAQIPIPNGGYYEDRYLHSFFGYFPAYNPDFIIFIYQTNPKGAEYASQTLTDPFYKLVDFIINYYGVLPDR